MGPKYGDQVLSRYSRFEDIENTARNVADPIAAFGKNALQFQDFILAILSSGGLVLARKMWSSIEDGFISMENPGCTGGM